MIYLGLSNPARLVRMDKALESKGTFESALIDAGHFGTEQLMVAELSLRLRKVLSERQLPIEVIEMTAEQDPFTVVC